MLTNKLFQNSGLDKKNFNLIHWLSVLFAVIAITAGIGIGVAVGMMGTLILIAIPLLIIFVIALGQPQIGLMAFILITFTQLSNVGINFYGYPSLAQPLAGVLILLILMRITMFGERAEGWVRAGPLLVIYTLVWFGSLLHAADFMAARTTFFGFVKDALGGIIVIFFIQRPSSLKGAIWSVIFAGLFMGSICVFQAITGSYNNNFGGFGGWVGQTAGSTVNHRLTGPYENPNAFSQALVFIIPLSIDRFWHEKENKLRLVAGIAALVSILSVIFSYSRGGLLAMVFTVGLLLLLRRPKFMPMFFTAVLVLIVVQFLPTTYNERILSLLQFSQSSSTQVTDQSFLGRSSENMAAWQMFISNPLLGVGLGNYKPNYQTYSRQIGLDPRREARSPASLYLELLAEQGLIGTGIFIFLMIMIVRQLISARNNFIISGMNDEAFIVLAIITGFAGYMFGALVKNSAYANVFWVIVGIAMATGQVAFASRQNLDYRNPIKN